MSQSFTIHITGFYRCNSIHKTDKIDPKACTPSPLLQMSQYHNITKITNLFLILLPFTVRYPFHSSFPYKLVFLPKNSGICCISPSTRCSVDTASLLFFLPLPPPRPRVGDRHPLVCISLGIPRRQTRRICRSCCILFDSIRISTRIPGGRRRWRRRRRKMRRLRKKRER